MYPIYVLPSDPFYAAINYTQTLICALVNSACHFDMAHNHYGIDPLMFAVKRMELLDAQKELFDDLVEMKVMEDLDAFRIQDFEWGK